MNNKAKRAHKEAFAFLSCP